MTNGQKDGQNNDFLRLHYGLTTVFPQFKVLIINISTVTTVNLNYKRGRKKLTKQKNIHYIIK